MNCFNFSFLLENVFQLHIGLDLSCQGEEITIAFCEDACCFYFKCTSHVDVISPNHCCNNWSFSLSFCGWWYISLSIPLSINHYVHLSICPSIHLSVSKLVNQPASQPASRLVGWSVGRSIRPCICPSICPSINQLVGWSVSQLMLSAYQSVIPSASLVDNPLMHQSLGWLISLPVCSFICLHNQWTAVDSE